MLLILEPVGILASNFVVLVDFQLLLIFYTYPLMLSLSGDYKFVYIQYLPIKKTIVIKSPNPNNLDTIYTDEHDNSIKYKYQSIPVNCV